MFSHNYIKLSTVKLYTVVWGKFTIGYFCVKIVRGKMFSFLRIFNEIV